MSGYSNKSKNAFTLAEVLITLGVIGVVSAITMPTLIKNYKHKVIISKLKKAYTTLSQAYLRSFQDLGEPSYEEVRALNNEEYFNIYWKPYLKEVVLCKNSTTPCNYSSKQPFVYRRGEALQILCQAIV